MAQMKEVNTWQGVDDIDKSDIACRYRDVGTSSDVYESSSKPLTAHHVEGNEWVTGVVAPQDMHTPISLRWTWPTRAMPIRFGR